MQLNSKHALVVGAAILVSSSGLTAEARRLRHNRCLDRYSDTNEYREAILGMTHLKLGEGHAARPRRSPGHLTPDVSCTSDRRSPAFLR